MRAAKVVIVIWLLSSIALWIRSGQDFSVLDTLPFVERRVTLPADYDWAALMVLATGVWGGAVLLQRPAPNPATQPKTISTAALILVPAAVVGLAMLTSRVVVAVTFADVVGHPNDLLKFQCLAILGLLIIAVLLTIKWFRAL